MDERRGTPRLKEENKVTITVISGEENLSKKKITWYLSKNISKSGIRIQTNIFLPVNTQLKIEITLKNPPQMITAFAKVIWIKRISTNDFCQAGLKFFNTSNEMIQQLDDYISLKL
ncbi:MAG: PilZ domain-containing protein [Smithella sp.]|jgi:Tfp pilus assembly protein PilZ